MQNYYHSQYDNQDVYQEAVYQFHHECYLKLVMAIDALVLPPLNFSNTMKAVTDSIHENALSFADSEQETLLQNLRTATESARNIYKKYARSMKNMLHFQIPHSAEISVPNGNLSG